MHIGFEPLDVGADFGLAEQWQMAQRVGRANRIRIETQAVEKVAVIRHALAHIG